MLKVLLCHASGDKAAVRQLYQRLRADGFDPWLDEEKLLPGQEWQLEIPKAVRQADIVVVCLSNSSITKEGYVQKEIKFALDAADEKPEGTIFLIPARLEDCRVPERLSEWQWVDLHEDRSYEKLRAALKLRAAGLERAAHDASSVETTAEITPGTVTRNPKDGLEYVWIPPGDFRMGSVPGDQEAYDEEKPHAVRITKGFWLGRTPVTVAAYKRFVQQTGGTMPSSPTFNPGGSKEDHPIVSVTWHEAAAYCGWAGGRLPTEAEWERAARGGTEGAKYPWGNAITPAHANYGGTHDGTAPVLMFPPNAYGLHDMAGNVWELLVDWYDGYPATALIDPKGPPTGTVKVLRGGSWGYGRWFLRSSVRNAVEPGGRGGTIGFRCARDV
ncbi:MAG: SUMF1/EgtB/PvdO family nonheme iron enzyme [Acidobacteriota bacterium]